MIADILDTYLEAVTPLQRARTLAPLLLSFRRALQRAFRMQGVRYLRALRAERWQFATLSEALSQSDADALFDRVADTTRPLFEVPAKRHLGLAVDHGINQQQAEALGLTPPDLAKAMKRKTFAPQNPRVLQFMESRGGELVTGLDDTTRTALRKVLAQGAEEGWSYPRTAKEIRAKFDGFAGERPQAAVRDRAELIAKHELAEATEYGAMVGAQELQATGLTMQHRWYTSPGACPICAPNPSVGWIALGDAFPSGHTRAPGHVQCNCYTATRVKPGTRRAA